MIEKHGLSPAEVLAKRDLDFAKLGLIWALMSGMIWGLNGVVLDQGLRQAPFSNPLLWLLAPLTAAAMHDTLAGCWCLVFNFSTGRVREIGRSILTRPGLKVCLGALFGGPVGMGGYIVGLKLAGPAYVLPITSLYPAVASALAMIFLKERICLRAWLGLACCVAGAAIIGYSPPTTGLGADFYLGIGMAALATVGWGAEGVLSTSGMDLLDPAVALNIRQLVSGLFYLAVVLPVLGGWHVLGDALTTISSLIIFLAAGLGATSYMLWYRAMSMTGVSRTMAINVTYALWGILFSALFTDTKITLALTVGAVIITFGMLLVVGNINEMKKLRNAT